MLWETTIPIIAIHVLALLAPLTYTPQGLITFLTLYCVTATGITFCFHRLLSHRSFKIIRPLMFIPLLCGTLALQGGPIRWSATHRLHHADSDKTDDPHSPRTSGFWWSHLIWNFFHHPRLQTDDDLKRFALDLFQDPVVCFFEKYFVTINIASAVALFALGYVLGGPKVGLSMFIWGGFLRIVAVWHITWCINSVTHLFGYKSYVSNDESRNLWWLGILAMGEGWHNNHHAYQRPAKTGHKWYEIDTTYALISILEKLGIAYNVAPLKLNPAQKLT